MIPTSRPSIGKEELNLVKEVFGLGWLGMGSYVFDFEKRLCDFIGAKHAIAVNTGTSAMHIALDCLGLDPGDEVIVPSLTFVSTIQAIISCRLKPVFCDVEIDSLNMDVEDILCRLTKKTRVIMPVHYSGLPCRMEEILDIAKKHNIRVIEDAAHAFGSSYKGKKVGSFGDITCFSFDPIKNITCGEGGAVLTRDSRLAKKIVLKRILGIDKDTWHRYKNKRTWLYDVKSSGFRYHMSNINAAIGLKQLEKFDKFIQKKKRMVKEYDTAFADIPYIKLLRRDYENTAPFNYILKVKSRRDRLMAFLKSKGIESGIHYIPNHLHTFFRCFKVKLPVTEAVWKEILTLPLYFDLDSRKKEHVIDCVRSFFKKGSV